MSLDDLILRLTQLGFSQWEAKVYLALLQRSPVTGYQVSKESGVPRSMVYEVLGKLMSRGALITTHDGETTLYAPVPPLELMERFQREHENLTEGLKRDLMQVSHRSEEEYVWRIEGYENILARARKLVERAQGNVFAQMFAQEFERLRPALEAAAARGVSVALSTIGAVRFPAGRVVQLPVKENITERESLALLLVADRCEVLIGERRPSEQARASWARNRHLAVLVEGHVRRTLLIPTIYSMLDADGVLAVLEGDERALIEALLDRDKLARFRKAEDSSRPPQLPGQADTRYNDT